MKYIPTIGLEIHTELKTETKMFCGCKNDTDEKRPNFNVCPVCLGHPGTLPTINKKAVEYVLKLGLALSSTIPDKSKFDRKNYFYPDLPKGYQISQYDKPLCLGGMLNGIRVRRIHLEEDTGRLQHAPDGKSSLVDFNRAGLPLMELVTEPDIKSGEGAVQFAKKLQLIMRYLGIADADMERGQMRVEVNLSLMPTNAATNNTNNIRKISAPISGNSGVFGTKVEIKNLNSFRAVQDAIDFEIKRQEEALEGGEKIIQETRGWDENKRQTFSQRQKEESHDYRYFPEPDLPPLDLTKLNLEELRTSIPELPDAKRERFIKEYGLSEKQMEVLIENRELAKYFEESMSELKSQNTNLKLQTLYNYLTSDLLGLMNQKRIGFEDLKTTPEHFAHLIALVEKKEISSRMAKDILLQMFKTGSDPHQIMKEEGMAAVHDEDIILKAVKEVLGENPSAIADYKKGKMNALQFLIGKTMARLNGQGNPVVIQKILEKELIK